MNDVLLGAAAMGFACVSLFFVRFWRRSGDTFHLLFAGAFALLAGQRVLLAAIADADGEVVPVSHLLRVLAYLLIVMAVVRKNFAAP